jgi:hypothetical protein
VKSVSPNTVHLAVSTQSVVSWLSSAAGSEWGGLSGCSRSSDRLPEFLHFSRSSDRLLEFLHFSRSSDRLLRGLKASRRLKARPTEEQTK